MNWLNLSLILLAFPSALIGVEWWRRFALRRRLLDVPNQRSSHKQPTPRGGGVIIFAVTMAFWLIAMFLSNQLAAAVWFAVGASLIAIVSYVDDVRALPASIRFAAHFIAAMTAVCGVGYFQNLHAPSLFTLDFGRIFGQILTVVWIVGLTNAYNFMDGIDGIAGAQGVAAGIGWSLIGWMSNDSSVMLFGGLLAATCAGFLRHNWPPARIFMGDVGAAFLGYAFAALPLLHQRSENAVDGRMPIVAALLVWPFVLDASLTFLRRLIAGENVFAAHRSHFYQKLVIKGFEHQSVTLLYSLLAGIGVAISLLWLVKK